VDNYSHIPNILNDVSRFKTDEVIDAAADGQ
jgi:hypothetical protein